MSSLLNRTFRYFIKDLGDPVFYRLSTRELARLCEQHPGKEPEDILRLTGRYKGYGWYKSLRPYQVTEEFTRLIRWVAQQKPGILLEIGTGAGGTLVAWSRIVRRRVISVDLTGQVHGGGYHPNKKALFKQLWRGRKDIDVDLLLADSHSDMARDQVEALLNGEKVDILFIDGDHTLEGVTRDWEIWHTLVKPGGHVIFHDILACTKYEWCQVNVLWERLKREYPTQEIVADPAQGWAGLGILTIPDRSVQAGCYTLEQDR